LKGETTSRVQRAGSSTGKAIQAMVLFSTILGVLFLVQANGVLPAFVFDFVAIGWCLFAVDSVLTFSAPRPAYALAFVLSILALGSSVPQSAHWAFISNGDLLPAATFVAGVVAQFSLIVLVPYHFIAEKRRPA
jgi:hypothetical protein